MPWRSAFVFMFNTYQVFVHFIHTDVVDCASSSCNSNGDCIEVVGGGFVCSCEDGWGGDFCNVDAVDDCLSEPCENGGSCTDGLNNYTCDCVLPWSGITCASGRWIE